MLTSSIKIHLRCILLWDTSPYQPQIMSGTKFKVNQFPQSWFTMILACCKSSVNKPSSTSQTNKHLYFFALNSCWIKHAACPHWSSQLNNMLLHIVCFNLKVMSCACYCCSWCDEPSLSFSPPPCRAITSTQHNLITNINLSLLLLNTSEMSRPNIIQKHCSKT